MPSLLLLVMHDTSLLHDVLSAWREAGAPAVTILDSVGTQELGEKPSRDDLPLMPSISDFLQSDDAPRKTLFSVVEDDRIEPIAAATQEVLGDLTEENKGILFALPVSHVWGQRT